MREICTRIAIQSDVDSIATLFDAYRQFYEQPPDLHLATSFIQERILNNESVVIVAEIDGYMMGFCQMYPTFCSVAAAPIYTLYDLFVLPEARKMGAGKALLLAAEQHAAHAGSVRMDLTTAKANSPAQSLYESLGWIRDEDFYAYSKSGW